MIMDIFSLLSIIVVDNYNMIISYEKNKVKVEILSPISLLF